MDVSVGASVEPEYDEEQSTPIGADRCDDCHQWLLEPLPKSLSPWCTVWYCRVRSADDGCPTATWQCLRGSPSTDAGCGATNGCAADGHAPAWLLLPASGSSMRLL